MIICPLLLCIVPMYVFEFWAGGLYYVINNLLTYFLSSILNNFNCNDENWILGK